MVEILVTLVLIATELLVTAGLQAYALQVSKSGESRTQAVFMASDIAERMEANKAQAILGSYAIASTSSVTSPATMCDAAVCDPVSLANWDIWQWGSLILANGGIPQATWSITATGTNPIAYSIKINWVDRRSKTTYATPGSGEPMSYTTSRTIRN